MKPGTGGEELVGGVSAVAAMRRMSAAMRSSSPAKLEAAINSLLQVVPMLQASWIEIRRGAESGRSVEVGTENLVIPVTSGKEIIGALKRPVTGSAIGAEELRFLAAAADLASAVVSVGSNAARSRELTAALGFALDQLPVAVVCFRPGGAVLCFNRAAAEIAGRPPSDAGLSEMFASTLKIAGNDAEVVSIADRMVLASAVDAPRGSGELCARVVTLIDLTDRAAVFANVIEREIYRALWLKQPLTLVVAGAGRVPELISATEALEAELPGFCGAGPIDVDAYGFLVRGRRPADLRAVLRKDSRLLAVDGLRLGMAELTGSAASARGLIDAAVQSMSPVTNLARPSLLLWDGSISVTDALSIALRDASETVACNDRRQCLRLVSERSFDGIFAKVDLNEWEPDLELVRAVLGAQPAMVPFLVTDAPGPYRLGEGGLPENATVFRKPFSVVQIRAAVAEHFSG